MWYYSKGSKTYKINFLGGFYIINKSFKKKRNIKRKRLPGVKFKEKKDIKIKRKEISVKYKNIEKININKIENKIEQYIELILKRGEKIIGKIPIKTGKVIDFNNIPKNNKEIIIQI